MLAFPRFVLSFRQSLIALSLRTDRHNALKIYTHQTLDKAGCVVMCLDVQAVADVVKQQAAEARAAAQKDADAVENKRLQSVQRRTSKEVLQQVIPCCPPCCQVFEFAASPVVVDGHIGCCTCSKLVNVHAHQPACYKAAKVASVS